MKMPGKSATSAPAASEENKSPRPPTSAAQVAPPPAAQEEPAPAAPTRSASESSTAQETVAGNGSLRALLWLSDTNHSDAMSSLLGRLGYQTEYLDIWEQKVEDIHQGRYDVIVTNRNGASPNGERDLFRLVNRLAPETRRRIFMVLVGDEFKTGNGTQAFTAMADLVCHPQDVDSADVIFRSTVTERARFYRSFLEIEDKL
jgi:hypothetical protein